MQLSLQEPVVGLVALHMGIDSLVVVSVDLGLVGLQHVEGDIIGVRLNGVCEELNLEWNLEHLNELERESESS